MTTKTMDLVTYVFPDEEAQKQLEWEASNSWQVYDGEKWKFRLETREQAISYCKALGGTRIGYAVWNDDLETNDYRNVEVIE